MAFKKKIVVEPEIEMSQTTAIVNWDEELAAQAKVAAAMEANVGGGQYFSLQGGILSFNDTPMPGNHMAVIILDSVLENVFYEGAYDPKQITPPTCFAFGRDDATIAPHKTVFDHDQAQNEKCAGCPMNAFGTANIGGGKACQNRRRLAMIPAGELKENGTFEAYDDIDQFTSAPIALLKLPTMSIKGYATFVKQVAGTQNRPPFGIFTRVRVVPDVKSQFRVLFEPLGPVPNNLMPAVFKRNAEAKLSIDTPYNLDMEERAPAAAAPARGKAPVKNVRPEVKKPSKKY